MEILRTSLLWVVRILVMAILTSFLHAETVIPSLQQNLPLNQRWDWAKKEALNQNFGKGYWIGYSIQRWMGEREYFITGSNMNFDNLRNGRPSLSEVILGKKEPGLPEEPDDQKVKRAATQALADLENSKSKERQVLKDIAVLVEFRSGQSKEPDDFAMLNMSLSTDLEKRPILWLGRAEDGESLTLLQQLYQKSSSDKLKEDLIHCISSHANFALVLPFLQKILFSDAPDKLRSAAAIGMGEQDSEEAVPILLGVSKNDRSSSVRDDALNGLAEIDLPSARAALMELAKTGKTKQLREDALYRIAENASPKEVAEIKGILMNDPDREVQEAALYALAELEDATPTLIQVARTHTKRDLREAALYALAENGSKDAIATLNQIALNDPDEELQEAALYALAELEDGKGIPYVIEIARSHPDKETRIRAIQVLGNSDDSKAKEALLKLVED